TLCSSVKASCETRMKAYGFDWPEMLACNKYPEDNDMCITLIHDVKRDNNCSACKHPLTYEALIDHFCRADIVMRVTVKEIRDLHGDSSLIMRKKKRFFKTKEGISKKVARELKVIIKDGATCTCDTVEATQQRYLVMGYKSDDKLMLNFAMPWDKNNKEFKKGIRAIKKKRTCEGIFQELSNNGSSLDPGARAKAAGSRRGRGGKQNRRQKGRKKGNRKNRRKGKGKGKGKGRKRRVRKGKKMRKRGKNQRKQRRGSATPTTSSKPSGQSLSITEIEDRALSNFRRASN
ncbi:secreted frizzled-related protein 5-like, partial [Plakobranchus ocellatus]